MYYEINVSLNGAHLFATAPRSIGSREELKRIGDLFREKFPEADGYKITATEWRTTGKNIDIDAEG